MRLEARVDREEALRYLGYSGQVLEDELVCRFEDSVALCEGSCGARGLFAAYDVRAIDLKTGVELEGLPFALPGTSIAHHLSGAKRVVLMAATLGLESERLIRQRCALSPTEGLMVDAAASSMAEAAAEALHEQIRAFAREAGLQAGSRFSPGYGDLPLSIQGPFLRALGADKLLGMNVTESNMLVPAKSVTAVVGLYESYEEDEDERFERERVSWATVCPLAATCARLKRGKACNGCQLK